VRPSSHRDQVPEKGCYNCRHSHVVEFKGDLLCFHGDNARFRPSDIREGWITVTLDGRYVGDLEGDEWSKVWGGRLVASFDVCDEHDAEPEEV